MMTKRRRSIATVAASALVGAALGAGSVTAALWFDSAHAGGRISSGYEYFAAGFAGATEPVSNGSVSVRVGADEAQTLKDDGAVSVVLQTDSVSQGNKGLRYTITEPKWGEGYFGSSAVDIYWVDSPAQCDVDGLKPTPPSTVSGLTSAPVPVAYSSSGDPTTEYWCLVATLDKLPGEGRYENTATAKGDGPDGTTVEDRDDWNAAVTTAMDPADESDHSITFHYDTFRPGEQP